MANIQTLLREERGTISKIATGLSITPGAVSQWRKVPAERVLDVERITGIPRAQLRPDLFGSPANTPPTEGAAA